MGKAAEMDMHIKQMNQLPCEDRKPYNYINKCAPDRPPLGGFMLWSHVWHSACELYWGEKGSLPPGDKNHNISRAKIDERKCKTVV